MTGNNDVSLLPVAMGLQTMTLDSKLATNNSLISTNVGIEELDKESIAEQVKHEIVRANTYIRDSEWQKAERISRLILSMDSGSVAAHELLFAAIINSSKPERYVEVIRSALDHCDVEPKFRTLEFVLAAMASKDVKTLFIDVYAKWPDGRISSCLAGLQGSPATLNVNQSNQQTINESNAFGAQAFRLTLRKGKEEAFEYLEPHLNSPNDVVVNRAAQVRRMIQGLPEIASFNRPLVIDDGAEIIRSERASSGTTVLYFNGLGVDLEHSYEFVDSYFSAAGYSSVFIRDRSLNLCMKGLSSLEKNREETLLFLKDILYELGTTQLIVVGRSAGGFSALQYGLLLEANKIVAFSGATNLTKQYWKSIGDNRGKLVVNRLNRENAYDDLCLDNVFYKSNTISDGVHMHYGANSQFDRNHAELVSGPLSAYLYSIPGFDSHHCFHHYLENGKFLDQLAI